MLLTTFHIFLLSLARKFSFRAEGKREKVTHTHFPGTRIEIAEVEGWEEDEERAHDAISQTNFASEECASAYYIVIKRR